MPFDSKNDADLNRVSFSVKVSKGTVKKAISLSSLSIEVCLLIV